MINMIEGMILVSVTLLFCLVEDFLTENYKDELKVAQQTKEKR